MLIKFNLPDVGEGLHQATIHEWHVSVNDKITPTNNLVSIETAKSLIDIPSPFEGVIKKIYNNVGDTIGVGSPLVEIETKSTSKTIAGSIPQDKIDPKPNTSISALPSAKRAARLANIPINSIAEWRPNKTLTPKDIEDFLALKNTNLTPNAFVELLSRSWKHNVHTSIFEDLYLDPGVKDINAHLLSACGKAIKENIDMNIYWNIEKKQSTQLDNIELGLVIDTSRGTRIPSFTWDENQTITSIREHITTLKNNANKKNLDKFKPYSCVITNIGHIAGKYATPILPPGCNFILAVGKCRCPINTDLKLLPITLTFNHLAMTGAKAAYFLKSIIDFMPGKIG